MRIYDHLHYLNTNHSLYNVVVKAEQEVFLGTEAHRAAHALCTDFEKGKIHLSAEKMDRVNQLNTEIVQLGCYSVYNNNKKPLSHNFEGDLGFLYLDLYSRRGKYPGCAQFSIRGGRRLYETRVPATYMNSPCQDYQHYSGTRVFDLAETPSNLFKYYAWDYRVLRTFARHYTPGDMIPEKLVDAMNSARNMFAATELQRQIYLLIVDFTLFGEQSSSQRDTTSVVADLKTKYTSWNHVEGISWQTRFTPLINYGAGYYSYLYATSLAATIWQDACSEDPLPLSTGTAIRTKFLQHGGAKDPVLLLNNKQYNFFIPYYTCIQQ